MGANAQRLIADLDQLRAAMPNAMPEDLRTDVLNMLTRIDRLVDTYPRPPFSPRWIDDLDDIVRRLTARLHAQQVDG